MEVDMGNVVLLTGDQAKSVYTQVEGDF